MPNAKVTIVNDTITPTLKQLRAEANTSKKVLTGVAIALNSWIVQSFSDESKRIEPWKNKKNGLLSTLQKSTKLRQSIRVHSVTEKEAEQELLQPL